MIQFGCSEIKTGRELCGDGAIGVSDCILRANSDGRTSLVFFFTKGKRSVLPDRFIPSPKVTAEQCRL